MRVPERMCVGCRQMKPKSDLIRIVKTAPDDLLVIDEQQKILSRGIYVCKDDKCILNAKKKKALNRFKKSNVPDDFYEKLMDFKN